MNSSCNSSIKVACEFASYVFFGSVYVSSTFTHTLYCTLTTILCIILLHMPLRPCISSWSVKFFWEHKNLPVKGKKLYMTNSKCILTHMPIRNSWLLFSSTVCGDIIQLIAYYLQTANFYQSSCLDFSSSLKPRVLLNKCQIMIDLFISYMINSNLFKWF